ncbi:MAG: MFS transporter [Flavobacteriaceae bacterium]|nr:MFS transporter [Flavobacteriaceae bacterium]
MSSFTYPRTFWIMCMGAMSFFLSFNIILPELPTALRNLGGAEYVGWIIPAFSVSALIARPISGWITDNMGRRWTMIGGCLFCIVAGCFYPLATTVMGFLFIRILHGFSTGFTPTGFISYTADIVDESHRGRAMGWQGFYNNVGTSLGYAFGAVIALHLGMDNLYYTSILLALIACILFLYLPETMPKSNRRAFRFDLANLFYWPAWKPSMIMFLVCISLGSILTVMPDFTVGLGFNNKGLFLSLYIASSLVFRLVSGKISDRLGRPWSTAIGTGTQVLSMGLLLFIATQQSLYSDKIDPNQFLVCYVTSAILYGIGQGFNAPSLFAWASDTADIQHRGRALAMLFIFLELGIIFGGLAANFFLGNTTWNYAGIFAVSGIAFLLAFGYSILCILNNKKPQ